MLARVPRPLRLALLGLLAAALVVSRRPDVLLHANLWAEDGWRWYPDAYAHGWHTLLVPWTGYLQTWSRLIGLLGQAVPLAWVPTLFAASAILVQAVAASFIVSERLAGVCPNQRIRLLFALIYLLLPNSFEVYANLTNAQWHLGLLAFLVVVADRPRSRTATAFDIAALCLSVVSGPLCLLLLPVALGRAALQRDRTTALRAGIVCVGVLLQLLCLLGGAGRGGAPVLDAGPRRLALILSLQVILPLLIGRHSTPLYDTLPSWQDGMLPSLVALLAAGLTLRTLWTGRPVVRWACLFAGLAMAAALLRPATGSAEPAWITLSKPDVGDRYYMLPMLAWAVVLLALSADRNRALRWIGRALVLLLLVMLPGDWHLPTAFTLGQRNDFVERAHRFALAPPGTVMSFPVDPAGVDPMWLRKR